MTQNGEMRNSSIILSNVIGKQQGIDHFHYGALILGTVLFLK